MRIWAISAVVVSLAATAPAYAQKSQDATTAEARARFNEGMKFADDGNHEAARLKFSQAWTLLKSPAVLYNLARSEQLSGHLVDALTHYRLFGKMSSDPKVTEQQKQRALENIAKLSEQVGQIDIDAAPAAHITIDGQAVDWTPQGDPIPVLPGAHEVTATVDGTTVTVRVECAPGTVANATMRAVAKAPLPGAEPSPAPVTTGATTTSSGSWTPGRIAGLAIAGGGLVTIGLGFFFHITATNAGEEADEKVGRVTRSGCNDQVQVKPPECAQIAALRDDQSGAETIRNGLWIGGGALVVGGAALFLLSRPKPHEKTRAWHLVPLVSPTVGGLSLGGTF